METAVARFRGLALFLGLLTWGSAALHPRLYAVARFRGLALFLGLLTWGSASLRPRLYAVARYRGLDTFIAASGPGAVAGSNPTS